MALDPFFWATPSHGKNHLRNGFRYGEGITTGGNITLIRMPSEVVNWQQSMTVLHYDLPAGQSIAVHITQNDPKHLKLANHASYSWVQLGTGLTTQGKLDLPMPFTALRITTTAGATTGKISLLA